MYVFRIWRSGLQGLGICDPGLARVVEGVWTLHFDAHEGFVRMIFILPSQTAARDEQGSSHAAQRMARFLSALTGLPKIEDIFLFGSLKPRSFLFCSRHLF